MSHSCGDNISYAFPAKKFQTETQQFFNISLQRWVATFYNSRLSVQKAVTMKYK